MPACILDSTVLDELGSPEWRRALLEAGYDLVVPTVVLAERDTGRPQDHQLRTALQATRRPTLDEARAHAAGELRGKVAPTRRRAPSAVDAVVVAVADDAAQRDAVLVLTSDVADFEALRTDRTVVEHPSRRMHTGDSPSWLQLARPRSACLSLSDGNAPSLRRRYSR